MQIAPRLSALAAVAILASQGVAEDYVNVQMLYYDEKDETTTVVSPAVELNLDLGVDYTLNAKVGMDALTGASETYYDKSYQPGSGASPYKHALSKPSAYARGKVITQQDVGYGPVDYRDYRYSGSVALTRRLANRDELTGTLSYNNEYDYHIPEAGVGYKHWLDEHRNSSIEASVAYQMAWVLIWCRDNDYCDTNSGASEIFYQHNTFAQMRYRQVIDRRSKGGLTLFYNHESGFLSNPYKNIVRDYDTAPRITNERRPDKRDGYGFKVDYECAVSASDTLQGSYRYYHDDWHLDAHTIEGRIYHAYSSRLRLDGMLRYYRQSAAWFYHGGRDYFTDEAYASSDIRLGKMHSWFAQGGLVYRVDGKLSQNFYLNYYRQDNGLHAVSFIVGEKYRF